MAEQPLSCDGSVRQLEESKDTAAAIKMDKTIWRDDNIVL